MSATVMITTGGTGGHVFPGLAVAARLIGRGCRVFWLGTRDGIEAKLVPQHGVEFEGIRFAGVRGKGLRRLLLGPFALLNAFRQSLAIIRRRAPDVVLGLGGFASFPGALMGVACGKPLVIHEANAVAGLANRVLAYGADRILLGFPGALSGRHGSKVEWVGNPVRDDIAAVASPETRYRGRTGPLRLLVLGGSLGAAALNSRIPAALALLSPAARPLVAHQAGERNLEAARAAYSAAGVEAECVAFFTDMAQRYALADLVISRSGGLTVAELAAVGVAAVLVPLPGAIADEQTHNARFLVDAGGAVLMPQAELEPERVAEFLHNCSREGLLQMAIAARRVGRRDAAERVAQACAAEAKQP
ncbi:MAG TPA: undecaprenyldiphospho-muramoylpentapeptide beta-N-acetylglucosaminyltransferase [Casimicrobiaceae bacterium]|jgi:UDP-N-acetylglucosamine--N-acetylmuramyl-(pentapeptide) pyrophosphoryl-undecaprenol N-acetylglucosamine transferase|nr:undecaprenyldiphospho-muramoylpentapeptide beta-N-acetylglucosaminyltransferase [Casimicrobiaceae bacterium]